MKMAFVRPAAAILVLLNCAYSYAQFDETWTVMINGQTAQMDEDGGFSVPNVAAQDLFGPGGPGSAPDFLSDQFLRAISIKVVGNVTFYAFSEPFQIGGEEVFIGEMTVTTVPPPFPESLQLSTSKPLLSFVGETAQISVKGVLADGSQVD